MIDNFRGRGLKSIKYRAGKGQKFNKKTTFVEYDDKKSTFIENVISGTEVNIDYLQNAYLIYTSKKPGVILFEKNGSVYNNSTMHADSEFLSQVTENAAEMDSAFLAGDRFTGGNMCHVIVDHLCRAYESRRHGIKKIPILFYDTTWDWSRGFIDRIVDNCYFLEKEKVYFFKRLYLFSNALDGPLRHPTMQYFKNYCDDLQACVHKFCFESTIYPRRLYQSRLGAVARKMGNEELLIDRLERAGIKAFEFTGLSVRDQLMLFFNAETIIAPHGAGLTNLIASRPKTDVIEIFFTGTDVYREISKIYKLNYKRWRNPDRARRVNIDELLDYLHDKNQL